MVTNLAFDLGFEDEEEPSVEDIGFFDEGFDKADKVPDRYSTPQVDELIEEAIVMLANARPLPMTTTVKINRDELLQVLEQAQDKLPEEIRAARWLLKERDDFVAKAREEHADLIDEGRQQVKRMVEREQVVKAAELRARQIISEARDESNTIRRQTEEFCEKRLGSIEEIMENTIATMQRGRERLVGVDADAVKNPGRRKDDADLDLDIDMDSSHHSLRLFKSEPR